MLDKRSGQVACAVMSFGGFLGLGTSCRPLPWHVLTYDAGQDGYVVDLDKGRLAKVPSYAEGEEPGRADRSWSARIDDYHADRPGRPREEAAVDDAVEGSFPSSDPPAWTSETGAGAPRERRPAAFGADLSTWAEDVVTTTTRSTGGCACGAVRFAAEGEPYRVGLCHCFDCRKQHGTPFSSFAIFPADRVDFAGDEPGVYASSAKGRHYFCRSCGSPVFSRDEGSDEVELFTGAFDAVGRFAPTYEGWVSRREPWLPEIPSVVRRYDRDRAGPQRTEP